MNPPQLKEMVDYIMIFSIPECNLLCNYCRKDDRKSEGILTNEEILKLAQACYDAGIRRIRWTGGEPTLRKNFVSLVSAVKNLGIKEQYLSTNGSILHKIVADLKQAGIKRVNISLDTFDKCKFYEITGKDLLDDVLKSIYLATREFKLVKVNSVLISENIEDVYKFIDFISQFPENPPIPRFIPIGGCGGETEELQKNQNQLKSTDILNAFLSRYGSIEQYDKVENNNPYTKYYIIKSKGVIFGLASSFFSRQELNPLRFKTLRINPNGYFSNDLYSHDIYYLPGLEYQKTVDLIKRLIEDKKRHDKEWYVKAMNRPIKYDMNFWRFGRIDK